MEDLRKALFERKASQFRAPGEAPRVEPWPTMQEDCDAFRRICARHRDKSGAPITVGDYAGYDEATGSYKIAVPDWVAQTAEYYTLKYGKDDGLEIHLKVMGLLLHEELGRH